MIGILLALQVNNWNQNRQEAKKQEFFIREINTEFRANKIQLESKLQAFEDMRDFCNEVSVHFPLTQDNVDSAMAKYIRPYMQPERMYSFDPSQSSIESLVNSSSIDLIKSEKLINLLISWKGIFMDYKEDELIFSEFVKTQLIPFKIENIKMIPKDGKITATLDDQKKWFVFENLIRQRHDGLNWFFFDPVGDVLRLQQAIDSIIFYTDPHTN